MLILIPPLLNAGIAQDHVTHKGKENTVKPQVHQLLPLGLF